MSCRRGGGAHAAACARFILETIALTTEHPDARHLRCFVAAAEAESLRGAARRLGLAQPTITEHIQRLESILGFAVFDRIGRSITLTERGRLLLPRARAALRAVEGVAEGIGEAVEAGAGRLAVGAIPTMSPYLLPRVISRLRADYPECEVIVHEDLTERLLERIDDHSIDIAVLSPPVDHPRIEIESLGSERMVVVAPEDDRIVPAAEVTLSQLRSFPRISLSEMHCLGNQIESFCTKRDLTRQVACHATQLETVFELVRLGLGLSLVPGMALRGRPREGVRCLKLRREAPTRSIGIATKVGRTRSLLADRFTKYLSCEVRELIDA